MYNVLCLLCFCTFWRCLPYIHCHFINVIHVYHCHSKNVILEYIYELLIANLRYTRGFCSRVRAAHGDFQELMNKITGFTRTGLKP